MNIPELPWWVVDRLTAERDAATELLESLDADPDLRVADKFAEEVEYTDESLEFALNLAADGDARGLFAEIGLDYSGFSFGTPAQRLALRVQMLDALLVLQPKGDTKDTAPGSFRKKYPKNTGRERHIVLDAFVSHATEDKKDVVEPLVTELKRRGLAVWYDVLDLKVGDSLRQTIDHGLAFSRFGIVVLSRTFLQKEWTQYELNGLLSREMEGRKVILPIWHRISKEDLLEYSPSLVDKVALSTDRLSIQEIASRLYDVMNDGTT